MSTQGDPVKTPVHSNPATLLPRLGLFTAVMIIMGNMIGSGVFKKAAPMAAEVQSAGLLLAAWLVAGIISFFGALANAEVSGMIADPGGQYAFFKRMYGRLFAFMFGWTQFAVIGTASIASIAYVFGESSNALYEFPRLPQSWDEWTVLGIFQPFNNFGVKAFTIATIILLSAANYFGVVYGGLIASISSILKLTGLGLLVVFGLFFAHGTSANLSPFGVNPDAAYATGLGLTGAFYAAMLGAFWAYDGWMNITYLGGEVKNPNRTIPLALGLGVGGVVAIYLIVNLTYLYVMPVSEMAALTTEQNRIVAIEVVRKGVGGNAALLVTLLIMLSTFGAVNCSLLPTSRMYFAMARDRLFFESVGHCHPKYRTPTSSIVFQAVWASLLVLSGSFDQLSDMVIFASFIFYGASAFGVFVLRRTMHDTHRPYRVHGYPVVPALFVLFCASLVLVTIWQRPRDAGIGLALILSGLPFYVFWARKLGPASTARES
ncbi:MAG: amino acid transporter [Candidatus Hydrogenedentota bacterium]